MRISCKFRVRDRIHTSPWSVNRIIWKRDVILFINWFIYLFWLVETTCPNIWKIVTVMLHVMLHVYHRVQPLTRGRRQRESYILQIMHILTTRLPWIWNLPNTCSFEVLETTIRIEYSDQWPTQNLTITVLRAAYIFWKYL